MRPAAVSAPIEQLAFAAALLDPALPCPAGLRAWNGSDPAARLAVYRNNVVCSLIDALADTFPVVQQLVGPDFFCAMAGVFVRQAPPKSRVLAHYGQAFPAFLARFEPAQTLPYLADVARLEMARVVAYHAADVPGPTDEAVSLALASGDRTGELQLSLHPSLTTLVSNHAVVSLWAAHQTEAEMEGVVIDEPEGAIVLRAGLDVLVLLAPPGSVAFIQALQQGQNLGEAAVHAATAASAFDLAATLSLLLAHGALAALHLPPRLNA
jgi:hypothetical protein